MLHEKAAKVTLIWREGVKVDYGRSVQEEALVVGEIVVRAYYERAGCYCVAGQSWVRAAVGTGFGWRNVRDGGFARQRWRRRALVVHVLEALGALQVAHGTWAARVVARIARAHG